VSSIAGPAASFGLHKKRAGTSAERIALVLSLSAVDSA
jgi:hypothetical protein